MHLSSCKRNVECLVLSSVTVDIAYVLHLEPSTCLLLSCSSAESSHNLSIKNKYIVLYPRNKLLFRNTVMAFVPKYCDEVVVCYVTL